jgi:hypothetical protein
MYAQRLAGRPASRGRLPYVSEQLSLARYARMKPDAAALRRAREAYKQLTAQLKPWRRRGSYSAA